MKRGVAVLGAAVLVTALIPALPPVLAAAEEGWLVPSAEPPLIGNGYLTARVPAAGTGLTALALPKVGIPLPVSTVELSDGPGAPPRTDYRQSLDLRTGTVLTTGRWTSAGGHSAEVRYRVLADRARPHVAVTRLEITPNWTGTLQVSDLLDGRTPGGDSVVVRSSATTVALASSVDSPGRFPVRAGEPVAVTRYLGVASSVDSVDPLATARAQVATAAQFGWQSVARENELAWGQLWRADIEVHGDDAVQRQVRAAVFAVLAGVRAGSSWPGDPAALPWTEAAVLPLHPDIATSMLQYPVPAPGPEAALSTWQYWLASGDLTWLRAKGFPVLRATADALLARPGVLDVPARDSLRFAAAAATLVGAQPDPRWTAAADRLAAARQSPSLPRAFPWRNDQPDSVTRNDLHQDQSRAEWADGVRSIVAGELGDPGCAAFTYTQRSAPRPGDGLVRSAAFVQEFVYGYPGLRLRSDAVVLDPLLPPQFTGITVNRLEWQGRAFSVRIGAEQTTVRLLSGLPLPIEVGGTKQTLAPYGELTVPTRRPDRSPTGDLARCAPVVADLADPDAPASSAVDGDPSTGWRTPRPQSALTVDLRGDHALRFLAATWGAHRPSAWTVSVSQDGTTWRTVARPAPGSGTVDLGGQRAHFLRVSVSGTGTELADLQMG
ncbi:hypothetical protein BC739_003425 [Kutzneria viridogrisea]|uniref:F5/8 type C domain-containing protein n=1 Tax=Kutzneria viridogrisea TaxID=47990 RepID=A0ABR6BHQ7_9PSEU|nr:hypothetical protein [Kutzneria viridogrisea]